MKKILTVFYSIVIVLAIGCTKEVYNDDKHDAELPDGTVFCENYVFSYTVPSEISIRHNATHDNTVCVSFEGEEITAWDRNKKDEFKKLCEKFGDMSFNRNNVPGSPNAVSDMIESMDITCDIPFDEKHPAGSSLCDIVTVEIESYREFIQSGYKLPSMCEHLSFFADEVGDKLAGPVSKEFKLCFPEKLSSLAPFEMTLKVKTETGEFEQSVTIKE